jgi:GxxExxY protein
MELSPQLNALTGRIIGAAIEVHRQFGPGLLESTYARCLQMEFEWQRLPYVTQYPVPLKYKGVVLDTVYRIDLVVEGAVVVELKCLDRLLPIHEAQLLTYLRLTGFPVGLLINFNVPRLADGVKRLANTRGRSRTSAEETERAEITAEPQGRRGRC